MHDHLVGVTAGHVDRGAIRLHYQPAAGREGIHHVRYPVADLAATLAALAPEGCAPIWSHALGPYKWAYCEHPRRDGVLIELLESPKR